MRPPQPPVSRTPDGSLVLGLGLVGAVGIVGGGAALVWGADSRLGLNDPEWDRRKIWDTRNQELLRH